MIRNISVTLSSTFSATAKGVELEVDKYTGYKGCYACITPNEEGRNILTEYVNRIRKEDDFDPKRIHITAMYSKEPVSFFYRQPSADTIFDVLIDKIETMVGHKGQTVVFGNVVCPKLHEEHASMRKFGARHTYDPFKSHVTLHVFEPEDWEANKETLSKCIDDINAELQVSGGLQVPFSDFKIADLKD